MARDSLVACQTNEDGKYVGIPASEPLSLQQAYSILNTS